MSGIGFAIITEHFKLARSGASAALHYRRMGLLLIFGLGHAYLFWHWDILYAFALCGMIAYLFRRVRPPILIVLGLLSLSVSSGTTSCRPSCAPSCSTAGGRSLSYRRIRPLRW